MEKLQKKFQLEFEEMQSKLRFQKDSEVRDQRDKYERQIEELKRNSQSDRDFL